MKKIAILFFAIFFLNNISNAQWTAVNTGLPTSGTSEFESFTSIGTNLFVGTGVGVYVTSDNGANWSAVNTGLIDTDIEVLASIGTTLFAGTGNGIFKSNNNGGNWTAINSGLDTSMGTSVYALFASGSNLFAGTEAGVFLSVSPYTSWTAVNTGLQQFDYYAFAQIGSYIFTGGLGVYRTSNNGASWVNLTSGLPSLLNSDFESFAVLGANVFAGDLGLGVYLSTDSGTNWSAVNTGLTDTHTQALAVDGPNLFAGGLNGGVFISINNGANWTAVNTGLTNLTVLSLQVFGSYLFAGTAGGVFRTPLSSFAGIKDIYNKNIHVNIFPNPCTKTFQITCDQPGIKNIEIYNVLGKCVLQKEINNKNIDVSSLTSGIYIIKVTGEGWMAQEKIIRN